MRIIWQPKEFRRFEDCFDTSTGPALVITDAGRAYVKALGNPEGPHVLACEWVGVNLARWLGLRTFDFALMNLQRDDDFRLGRGRHSAPGPAFATRAERGHGWGGDGAELRFVINKPDLSRMIVLDTWVRNRDRYVPRLRCHVDNVFLSSENTIGEAREVVAMDHTHCFADVAELTPRVATREWVEDERIYGAFPAFREFWDAAETTAVLQRLARFNAGTAATIVAGIPPAWEVNEATRDALNRFLAERSRWLSSRAPSLFRPHLSD